MKRILYLLVIIISIFLLSCKEKVVTYNISFDLNGGTTESVLPKEFKSNERIALPTISKENQIFVGWIDIDNEKENYIVTELENKNYNLKALFIDEFEYNDISENELFSQKEDNYLVYIHRDGCTWCNKIKEGVLSYIYKCSLPQFKDSKKVYTLNLTLNGNRASIFRTYSLENGDGDGSFKVNELTSIEEMYISSTPTLIEIKTIDGIRKAYFVENGATKVLNKINSGLSSSNNYENQKYTICLNTNGGLLEGSNIIEFYDNSIVNLPTPIKENYIFVGWIDESGFVEKIDNKDYDLSALWIENEDFDSISETEIFTQNEESYYIFVYRDGCSWCEKISDRVKSYIYKTTLPNYSSSKKVFALNLTKDGTRASVFRSFDGEDGEGDGKFKVTGCKDLSDMYLSSTPALIEINYIDGVAVAKFIATGATNVINAIEKELKYTSSNENKKSFQIEYDLNGGIFNSEPVTIYYSWQKVTLPIPQKEGFVFIGWYEDDNLVSNVSDKDYKLEARYQECKLPQGITVNDLYKLDENKYYVCFIKDDLVYIDELTKLLTLFEIKNDDNIYIINVDSEENKAVKRSYLGENGQSDTGRFYVDGVTSIDSLYIPKAAALIVIEKIDDKQVSTYLESGEEVLDYLKNILK